MITYRCCLLPLLAGAIIVLAPAAHAVTLAQTDDFESGSLQDWGGASPQNVASGGPLGVNDNFLRITADGSGSAGKLTTYNRVQWLGNYIVAGVTEIAMDLKGFSSPGSANLSIRVAFKTTTSGGSPGYVSSTPFSLPIDGQWHHAVFSLADMTAVGSPAPLNTLLAGFGEVRLLHSSAADTVQGDNIVGQFGVDNIQAVPEPSTSVMLALGIGAVLVRRRTGR